MKRAAAFSLMLSCWILADPALAAPGDRLNFLACPRLHDTTPNCWTAEYEGEIYYLGVQRGPDQSYLPQMKHQVLVEGVITDAPRICGGLVMKPLRVSVMPELDLSCDGPVLSGEGLTPPPLPARQPRRASRPPAPLGEEIGSFMRPEMPEPPYTRREFRIDFDFGTDLLVDQMQRRVMEIVAYAKVAGARKLSVKGYSSTTLLTDGRRLVEPEGLAELRARKIHGMLKDLGVQAEVMELAWADSPEEPDGIHDAERRRVEVTVEP
jgi:outer membrane protein OmpA-like peptidoglycan-associated protein